MQAIKYRSVIIRKWGFSPALLHSVFSGVTKIKKMGVSSVSRKNVTILGKSGY